MWTMLYMSIEYHIQVNMYHVSTQGVDEHMINVHYYLLVSLFRMLAVILVSEKKTPKKHHNLHLC